MGWKGTVSRESSLGFIRRGNQKGTVSRETSLGFIRSGNRKGDNLSTDVVRFYQTWLYQKGDSRSRDVIGFYQMWVPRKVQYLERRQWVFISDVGTKKGAVSWETSLGCYIRCGYQKMTVSREKSLDFFRSGFKKGTVYRETSYGSLFFYCTYCMYKSRCEKWHYQIRWMKCNLSKCSCKRRGYVRLRMIWLRHRSIGTSSIRIQIIFLIPLEPFRIKIRRSSSSITSKINIELHFAFKHFLIICFQFILRIIMFK